MNREILEKRKKLRRRRKILRILTVVLIFLLVAVLAAEAWWIISRGLLPAPWKNPEETSAAVETVPPESSTEPETEQAVISEPETSAETSGSTAEISSSEELTETPVSSESPAEETAAASTPAPYIPSGEILPIPDGFPEAENARVWVGDSRTEGLRMNAPYDPAKDFFIAKVGEAYRWFDGVAAPSLEALLQYGNVSTVLIDMGVNDCALLVNWPDEYGASDYAARINDLIDRYPAVHFVFYSVGPCTGNYAHLNEQVDLFNVTMFEQCRAQFIDTASLLKVEGFGSADGLHYDAATCTLIYNFVLANVE